MVQQQQQQQQHQLIHYKYGCCCIEAPDSQIWFKKSAKFVNITRGNLESLLICLTSDPQNQIRSSSSPSECSCQVWRRFGQIFLRYGADRDRADKIIPDGSSLKVWHLVADFSTAVRFSLRLHTSQTQHRHVALKSQHAPLHVPHHTN